MQNNNFNPNLNYGYNPYMPRLNNNNYMQPNYSQPNFYQPQVQPQPQLHNYAFVNGVEGAKGYQIQPNQTMMLMDSDNPYVYMKQSNSMGQSTLRYFKLVEIDENTARGVQNSPVEQVSIDTSQFVSTKEFNVLQSQFNALVQKLEGMGLNKQPQPKQTKGSE